MTRPIPDAGHLQPHRTSAPIGATTPLGEQAGEATPLASDASEEVARLERTVSWLTGEVRHWMKASELHRQRYDALAASTLWRALAPLRGAASRLSPATRNAMRRCAKAGWWAITPWRLPARLRFRSERMLAAVEDRQNAAMAQDEADSDAAEAGEAFQPASRAQPPLRTFLVDNDRPRVSMVADRIDAESRFGSTATALLFAAFLARRTGRRLRIVTRTTPAAGEAVATVFRANGVEWSDNIEFVFADLVDPASDIEAGGDEIFVTISWWTTDATRASVPDDRILYLMQGDERLLDQSGAESSACLETMRRPTIHRVVNSQTLHTRLVADGIVGAETPFFEPVAFEARRSGETELHEAAHASSDLGRDWAQSFEPVFRSIEGKADLVH